MIHVICLAAGSGSRFGSNKLMAELDGKPVCAHVMELLKKLEGSPCSVRVVTRYPQVAELAGEYGLTVVDSPLSHLGVSYTIKAAIRSLGELTPEDGLMFVLADQPYLTEQTLRSMLNAAEQGCLGATAVCHGTPGSPTLFRAALVPELLELEGDRGGRQVLNRHIGEVAAVEVQSPRELRDIDRPEDLEDRN